MLLPESLSLSPSQWTCQGKPVVQQLIQAQLKCKLLPPVSQRLSPTSAPHIHTLKSENAGTRGHTTNSGIHRHKTETVRARNQVFSWIWPPYALWVEQHWIHTLLSHSVLTAGENQKFFGWIQVWWCMLNRAEGTAFTLVAECLVKRIQNNQLLHILLLTLYFFIMQKKKLNVHSRREIGVFFLIIIMLTKNVFVYSMVIKIFRNHGIYMVHEYGNPIFLKKRKHLASISNVLTRLVALSALGCKAHMCVGGGGGGWMDGC